MTQMPYSSSIRFPRAPKTGTSQCGCGRTISGNKLLCKACGDAITAAVTKLVQDRQMADDGGTA